MSVSSLASCSAIDVIDCWPVFLLNVTHEPKAFPRGRPDQALVLAAVADCLACGVNPAG